MGKERSESHPGSASDRAGCAAVQIQSLGTPHFPPRDRPVDPRDPPGAARGPAGGPAVGARVGRGLGAPPRALLARARGLRRQRHDRVRDRRICAAPRRRAAVAALGRVHGRGGVPRPALARDAAGPARQPERGLRLCNARRPRAGGRSGARLDRPAGRRAGTPDHGPRRPPAGLAVDGDGRLGGGLARLAAPARRPDAGRERRRRPGARRGDRRRPLRRRGMALPGALGAGGRRGSAWLS